MKTKYFKVAALLFALALSTTSCNSFFNPSTDDELDGSAYISSSTEMYTGFLGIMTKLQAIGDKEILLTETRGETVEPTNNSTADLIALYNYNSNLQGNSYANPAGYYEVIIACNDYLAKLKEYGKNPDVDKTAYESLISSTVRIKAWTYKTIGEIYGQAVWFDDPVNNVKEFLASTDKYQTLQMPELVDRCLTLLDGGYAGVPANLTIDWISWLDPSNVTNIANSEYRKWNYMVPAYEGIYAELCLWKGAVLDSKSQESSAYYKKAADLMLSAIGTYVNNEGNSGNNPYWLPNAGTPGRYTYIWYNQEPYAPENVSAIIYDYSKSQTNTLVKHFSSEYPAEYLLRPSQNAAENYITAAFNPGASTSDTRYKNLFKTSSRGDYMGKFRQEGGFSSYRINAYQDDVQIYIYRATQYHMMLCEALNHLERFTALDCVLNGGINNHSKEIIDGTNQKEWEGFTRNWTADAEWGTRKYYSEGIRGCYSLTARTIAKEASAANVRSNDEQILNEYLVEFACEGKSYPVMNRMALRYNDLSIVADRVCVKYKGTALENEVRSKILSGQNYVPYNVGL